jgi:hypothetical protein
MGKFRIVNTTLGIDYTPTENYTANPTFNIIETSLETSPFTGKRDCILFAQYDRYEYDIRELTGDDYKDVFKPLLNQTVTFYPDEDEATNYEMNIIKATPYYLNSTVWKDALILVLKPVNYEVT